MKSIHLLTALLFLSVAPFADAQETGRTYKLGHIDSYKLQQVMSRPGLKHKSRGTLYQKVIKVYENGDADIETYSGDIFTTFIGTPESSGLPAHMLNKEAKTEDDFKSVNRLNRFGALANGKPANELVITASQYALAGVKSSQLKVGQKNTFTPLESSLKNGVTTVKAIKGNVVTLETFISAQGSPLKLQISSKIDRSTFQILSLTGKLSGLQDKTNKESFHAIDFTMTLVKDKLAQRASG